MLALKMKASFAELIFKCRITALPHWVI